MPTTSTLEAVSPPLKWAGGKHWQLPHIRPLWEQHWGKRLVEPFCGGLAIALGLRPVRALLNDANPHLINFYKQLKRGFTIEIEMVNDEDRYYAARDRFNALLSTGQQNTSEASQLFYYLNRTGYNGLCRFNSKGEFNVPFGRYKTIGYTSRLPTRADSLAHARPGHKGSPRVPSQGEQHRLHKVQQASRSRAVEPSSRYREK